MSKFVEEISDSNFKAKVLDSVEPVFVDFWAPWCNPCRMVAPIVEELAEQYQGKVKFCKINVDENPMTPGNFGIQAIPTLIIFKDGQAIERVVGAVPKAKIEETISKVL